jgi:hypothetical protein
MTTVEDAWGRSVTLTPPIGGRSRALAPTSRPGGRIDRAWRRHRQCRRGRVDRRGRRTPRGLRHADFSRRPTWAAGAQRAALGRDRRQDGGVSGLCGAGGPKAHRWCCACLRLRAVVRLAASGVPVAFPDAAAVETAGRDCARKGGCERRGALRSNSPLARQGGSLRPSERRRPSRGLSYLPRGVGNNFKALQERHVNDRKTDEITNALAMTLVSYDAARAALAEAATVIDRRLWPTSQTKSSQWRANKPGHRECRILHVIHVTQLKCFTGVRLVPGRAKRPSRGWHMPAPKGVPQGVRTGTKLRSASGSARLRRRVTQRAETARRRGRPRGLRYALSTDKTRRKSHCFN